MTRPSVGLLIGVIGDPWVIYVIDTGFILFSYDVKCLIQF